MLPRNKFFVSLVLLFALMSQETFAQYRDPLGLGKDQAPFGGTAEFVYRNDAEELLVPVFVLGAVARPGLYHIPVKTDFITLMSIVGGPTHEAVLDDISIKKQQSKEVVKVDLDKLVKNKDMKNPLLTNNDVVLVRTKEPIISTDTLLLITMIATVLGIGITALGVARQKQ
ncbi:MAG: SLBB domain-containing protein [Deltaproteobacteria bacterium]|nr:SLBB domain-containing protein [Deltaproteobacteria bacterium]